MANLRLTLACGPYDRTQALRDGSIRAEGIELNYITLQPAEIFWRMLQYKEFDVSEMSLSNYTSLVSDGNPPFIGIPVFPSRVFRHASPHVRRLFPNYAELEKDYYRRTKIYPIMHTVVIKREIYERDPWVALSLYKAFCRAKDYSYRLLLETGSPKASFAWLQPMIEEEQEIIGRDWYPYGIEANRPTIEALLQYTHEHGLSARRLKVEELFAPSTLRDIPLREGQQG